MPKHGSIGKLELVKVEKEKRPIFIEKLNNLLNVEVPRYYSHALFEFLQPNFFEKSVDEKYLELTSLTSNPEFMSLLRANEELTYLFLIHSVEKKQEFISKFKEESSLGKEFITPVEFERYPSKIKGWLGITGPDLLSCGMVHFSGGMYHHLSPDYFTKTPDERIKELNALRTNPVFWSYFELNQVTYQFIKKSVNDSQEHLKELKKDKFWESLLIPIEYELFKQEMIILVGEKDAERFSDIMFKLSPDFFQKTAQEKLSSLCEVRKDTALLGCLLQDKEVADNFLRKSLENNQELLVELKLNRLGQNFLISDELKAFNARVIKLLGYEVGHSFTDALFPHLSLDFFEKKPEARLVDLEKFNKDFSACLKKNEEVNDFLCKALDNSPELIARFSVTPMGQEFVLSTRYVRKRRLTELPERPPAFSQAEENKAYIEYRGKFHSSAVPGEGVKAIKMNLGANT